MKDRRVEVLSDNQSVIMPSNQVVKASISTTKCTCGGKEMKTVQFVHSYSDMKTISETPSDSPKILNGFESTISETETNLSIKKIRKESGYAQELPPMGIFWDIENIAVPRQKNAISVVKRIRDIFLNDFREDGFVVACDVTKENPQILQELSDSQVDLIHVSAISKNAADEKLRQSLRRFAEVHPAPAAVILISGDVNFASDLSDLRYRKKIKVILIHQKQVAEALIFCVNEHYYFPELIKDIPNSPNRKLKEISPTAYLEVQNLPKNIAKQTLKNKLSRLTSNCGGKCEEYDEINGICWIRFGNITYAERAHKRIQGEDIFGSKIKVLPPYLKNFSGQRIKNTDAIQSQRPTIPNALSAVPHLSIDYKDMMNPLMSNAEFRDSIRNYQESLGTCENTIGSFRSMNNAHVGFASSSSMAHMSASTADLNNLEQQSLVGYHRNGLGNRFNVQQEHATMALASSNAASHLSTTHRRTSKINTNSELADSDFKDQNTKIPNNQPVDLYITNLDPLIETSELRRLLCIMIKDYVMILSLNVIVQSDGIPIACLKVNSQQEAQYVISQLHRQKLGHKRITISYAQNNSPDPTQLRIMVVGVLQDVPEKKMPLFKFMEQLELKYLHPVSLSEVNKLKDVVKITDEMGCRVISLTQEAKITPSFNLSQSMVPYCILHCPNGIQNNSWWEWSATYIPEIKITLEEFSTKLMTILKSHMGSLPLLSFQECYEQEFHEPLPVVKNGVPLEHLITCVNNVEIKMSGPNKSAKFVKLKEHIDRNGDQMKVAPFLVSNVNLLCREVVDLIKTTEKCQLLLTKFIPAYHHHFGRQCRVADYGYTKLIDLFESISHVIQIMGDGTRRVITLTHSAQVRRFTSDLLKVLKGQPNKQVAVSDFAAAYEKTMNKPFNPEEYGLCYLKDLLQEVPDTTVVMLMNEDGVHISMPKREQTAEEIVKTKQFANQVIDLLRHTPRRAMFFNRFVPSYHHHFGYQCKVSDYGFTKLNELFEAIPEIVEIKELPDGERIISLTLRQSMNILATQIMQIMKKLSGSVNNSLNLDDLPVFYYKEFGYPLNPQQYECQTILELVQNLSDYVQIIHSNAGTLLQPLEMDSLSNLLKVRCWALLFGYPNVKYWYKFKSEYESNYSSNLDIDKIKDISDVVTITVVDNFEFITLTALYKLAIELYNVICNNGGSVIYSYLEKFYMEYYKKPLNLSNYNIHSINDFSNQFHCIFFIRGSKKKTVVLNRNLAGHIHPVVLPKSSNISNSCQLQNLSENGSNQNVKQQSQYVPPKPDTPPGPGTIWKTPVKDTNQFEIFLDLPISLNPTLLENADLTPPSRYITSSPWNCTAIYSPAPDANELPHPEKLLTKNYQKDDSGDSGVNIRLETSPSDNEIDSLFNQKRASTKSFMNFK